MQHAEKIAREHCSAAWSRCDERSSHLAGERNTSRIEKVIARQGEREDMRVTLLATVSATAIALGAFAAQDARADEPFDDPYGDWYISVFGGAAFNENTHSNYFNQVYEFRLKDGFTVGAAVGRVLAPGLRSEAEVSYLRHKNRDSRTSVPNPRRAFSGDTEALFILANLWKDFDVGAWSFYVGGGLGAAVLDFEGDHSTGFAARRDDSGVTLAAQLGGGIRIGLTDRLALDAGYRFKMAGSTSLEAVGSPFAHDSTLSVYDHIVQAGVTYALSENGRASPANAGDPDAADWYVSLFGGGLFGEDMAADDGDVFELKNKDGFTVGGAVGTNLAPGFRGELEVSYARQAAKSRSERDTLFRTASGHIEQLFVLGNLWKDIHLGPVSPYVGAGIGVGIFNTDDYASNGQSWDTEGFGIAGQFGAGVRVAFTDSLAFDAGYRFKSIINAFFEGDPAGFGSNGSLATYSHILQAGLTYSLGGQHVIPADNPDHYDQEQDWYATVFGGGIFLEKTHITHDTDNFLIDFDTGFIIGATLGTQVLPGVRGELEVSYARMDVNSSVETAIDENGSGEVGTVFVLSNLWKDFDIFSGVTPYAGGGIGMAIVDADIVLDNTATRDAIDDTSVALAGQIGAGVRVSATDRVSVDIGYRFKGALDVLTKGDVTGEEHGNGSYYFHVVQAGVGIGF
jgi:opacity protein-like surface antigen